MYIVKNALVSITRNKGRNFLIGIVIMVIACMATITLAIRSSAKNLIESYENQYDVTATVGINRKSMQEQIKMNPNMSEEERENQKNNMADIFSSANQLTITDIEKYGTSDYVKDYYYTLSVGMNSDTLEKVSLTFENRDDPFPMPNRGGKENFQNMASSDFTLIGYSSISAMENFIAGKYSMISGNLWESLDSLTCIINTELANMNQLNVGDEIILVDPENEDNEISLEIVGIFEETTDTSDAMGMFTTSANTILTPTNVVNVLLENNENMKKTVTPTFVLKNKEVVGSFEEELKEKGLNEYLSLTTNLDQVSNATSTISNVNTFATTFLILTLLIGGIVLFVINMINIRERKYEIGVLRTIGMKKRNLTMQFICELFLVSFIALLVGAGLGSMSSVSVSNYLLKNEINNSQEQRKNMNQQFGENIAMKEPRMEKINGMLTVQAFDSIDAVVNVKVLLQLFIIGILLTLISSLASMISIQKFSPLTILKERS